MTDSLSFFKDVKRHPDRFYIIHYSSQSLYGEDSEGFSPRVTSIVIMHLETQQTLSFTVHTIAESMAIPRAEILNQYDKIELELLNRFYNFVRDRREKYWVHWNMRNSTYGFEHLEHRFQTLCGTTPPHIPVEVRLNLNDILKERYGEDYVENPKMKTLMLANGTLDRRFLEGQQEAEAFKQQDYIRMNNSTISKVEFFNYVIRQAPRRKLKTRSNQIIHKIDKNLDSIWSRVALFATGILGGGTALFQIFLWVW